MYECKFTYQDGSVIHLKSISEFQNTENWVNAITDPSIDTFRYKMFDRKESEISLMGCTSRYGLNKDTGLTFKEEQKKYKHEQMKKALWKRLMSGPLVDVKVEKTPDELWYTHAKMKLWRRVYKEENDEFRERYLPFYKMLLPTKDKSYAKMVPLVLNPDELWAYKAWVDYHISNKGEIPDNDDGYKYISKLKEDKEYQSDHETRLLDPEIRSYWIPIDGESLIPPGTSRYVNDSWMDDEIPDLPYE